MTRVTGRSLMPLGGVLAAMAVSLTGTRVSAVSLPWFVLITTGSATQTGLVIFCEMAPYVVVKSLAGPLVDKTGPRLVSWVTDLVSAGAVISIPLTSAFDLLSFPLLLTLVTLIGASRGPGDMAKEVMVPEAAERGCVSLERAAGLSGATERLASTLGPAVGVGLNALLGPLTGLIVNGVCFVAGSMIIALALPLGMGKVAKPDRPPGGEPEAGYWRRLGQGVAFLHGDRLLLAIILVAGLTNLLDTGLTAVLLPVWAKESGNGPAAIGLAGSAMAAAAIGGSLVAAAVADRLPRRVVFFIGYLVAGPPRFLILALDAPLELVLIVFAISGFGAGFLNPIVGAAYYERIPRPMLGRVNALGDSLAWVGIPLGGLVAGASVTVIGLGPILLLSGSIYLLTTNLAGLRPEWRQMNRTRKPTALDGQVLTTEQHTATLCHPAPETPETTRRQGQGTR